MMGLLIGLLVFAVFILRKGKKGELNSVTKTERERKREGRLISETY